MPVIENNLFCFKRGLFWVISTANPRPVIILRPEPVILLSPVIHTEGTSDEDDNEDDRFVFFAALGQFESALIPVPNPTSR